MRIKALPLVGLILFVVLSLADLTLTWLLLQHSGGRVYEGNPVAGFFNMRYGFTGLAAFKVATLAFVGSVSLAAARQRLSIGLALLGFSCLAVGSAVAYSWRLLENFVP